MTDIVERLRTHDWINWAEGMEEAADEIERLRAERDSFYMDYRMKCDEETKALHVELERLRAEVAAITLTDTMHTAMLMKAEEERDRLRKLYDELIMAVGNKYEGESRHQTALRYIKRAEEVVVRPEKAALGGEGQ